MRHLMQGITSGRVQVLGIGARVSPGARLPEPWALSWSDGAWSWARFFEYRFEPTVLNRNE